MYNPGTGGVTGDIKWTQSRLGTQGWSMGIVGNPSASVMMCWEDVTPPAWKAPDDPTWTYLITPGKVPSDLFNEGGINPNGRPGAVAGGYWCGFGSDDVAYIAIQDRVIVSTNMLTSKTFVNSGLTNHAVDANAQTFARSWTSKGATDLSNPNVCYIFMGNTFYWTVDQFTTPQTLSWLPLATGLDNHPEGRTGIVAVDNASSLTSTNPRRSRIALCPTNQGVWISTDGFATSGTKITTSSGPGSFTTVSDMIFIGNKLYCCVTDPQTAFYDRTTSGSTGGAGGTGNLGLVDNIRVYDFGTSTWSILNHGGENNNVNQPTVFIMLDTRTAGAYFMWLASGDCMWWNGSAFKYYAANGSVVNGRRLNVMSRTKPRFRPAVASKYTYEGIGFAISRPAIIGNYLYLPLGLGPCRTILANWPANGFGPGDDPTGSKIPLMEEDTAGIEAKVGQNGLWLGDKAWIGAQDVALSLFEDGRRGQLATVYNFPTNGRLSDSLSMARGHVSNFGVIRRYRDGLQGITGNAYTLDNQTWQLAPYQPPAANEEHTGQQDGNPYIPGGIACGGGYAAVDLPGFPGLPSNTSSPRYNINYSLVPMSTPDIRSQPWVPINFYIGTTALDMRWGIYPKVANGFQGATFSNIHDLVAHDPDNPGTFYIWHLGSGTNDNDGTNWVYNPNADAGIYKLTTSDWPNARRVYNGWPNHNANFGLYDCKVLCGNGYLIFASNYLLTGADGWSNNKIRIFDTATFTGRDIPGPANFTSISFGDPFPGDTSLCLWGIGWSQSGQYGVWYCRNWQNPSPTWYGPFSVPTYGFPSYIDARRAVGSDPQAWGYLIAALKTRGAAIGQYGAGGT